MRKQMNTYARAGMAVAWLCANAYADWPTYGHDSQRSGWALEETKVSPANVSAMRLLWKAKLENESFRLSALTAPVVATKVPTPDGSRTVVYVGGIKGTVFALEAKPAKRFGPTPSGPPFCPEKAATRAHFCVRTASPPRRSSTVKRTCCT